MFVDVALVLRTFVNHHLPHSTGTFGKSRNAVNHVTNEMKAIHVVEYHHVKRGRGRTLFLEATNMQIVMVRPAVRQLMNQGRLTVKRKNNLAICGEHRIKLLIGQAIGVLTGRL